MMRFLAILAAVLAALPAVANERSTDASRLQFLEQSLDDSQGRIRLWQNGWTAVYSSAALTYAGLALDTDDSDERTLHALGSLRALMAVTLLNMRPHPGRNGADSIRQIAHASVQERLVAAERLLEDSARRTASKRRPARHLRNVLVNLGFGGLVWAMGDKDDALPFTLMGIAGGEALLWTLPEGPRRDLAGYRNRFGQRSSGAPTWRIEPRPGGIGIQFALSR